MRKKTKVASLVIVGALALCLVVAASPIAATAAHHNNIETGVERDATVKQTAYNLTLVCSGPFNVNVPFSVHGFLFNSSKGGGKVPGADIYALSQQPDGTWAEIGSLGYTNSGGYYGGSITAHVAGPHYFATVYYDSSGNATVSNVVEVTVS
jgi:hypothetical protein